MGRAGGLSGMPAGVPASVGVPADVLPDGPACIDMLDIVCKTTNSCRAKRN